MKILRRLARLAFPGAVLVAGFSAGLDAASPTSVDAASRHLERGQAQLSHGKYVKAERSFRRALDSFPELPEALLGLGHVHMVRRQFSAALDYYTRADRAWEDSREVLEALRVRRQAERLAEVPAYRRQVEVTSEGETIVTYVPTDAQPLGSGRNSRRASAQRPPEIDLFLGNACFELGRFEAAVSHWRALLAAVPDHAAGHFNLALALSMMGRVDDALVQLDRAIELGYPAPEDLREDLEQVWLRSVSDSE